MQPLQQLHDDALLQELANVVTARRQLTSRIVVLLGEVEARQLHLKAAFSSLYDFCLRRLGFNEGSALRHITAARICRRFPGVVAMIADGRLHLSGLHLLAKYLTPENHTELLAAACNKTKADIVHLVRSHFPRPDVPSHISREPIQPSPAKVPAPTNGPPTNDEATPMSDAAPVVPTPRQARIEPLATDRFHVHFTASAELRRKLERARDLMSHANPSRDLAVVIDRALDALIDKLERRTRAKIGPLGSSRANPVGSPRPSRGSQRAQISRATKRAVFGRDGHQCTWTADDGQRCPATAFLEVDHVQPKSLGGSDHLESLRLLCRQHNRLHAEQTLGKAFVQNKIHRRQQRYSGDRHQKLASALTKLGFTRKASHDALATLHDELRQLPAAELIRRALRVLVAPASAVHLRQQR